MGRLSLISMIAAGVLLGSCNQPFEPDGPVSNKLVVYSILNGASTTQYVRVGTTYQSPPAPDVRNASVTLVYNGHTVAFRDTILPVTDNSGAITMTNLYVAPRLSIVPGTSYTLQVSTPDGLTVSASTTTLTPPSFSLVNPRIVDSTSTGPITLNVLFKSYTGAAVMHFYLDYYAYVDGGWELHRSEIPVSTSTNGAGATVPKFPGLNLVQSFALYEKLTPMQFDPAMYSLVRNQAYAAYPAAPVIWLQAVFTLTQIDDALYNYYYMYNGPVDRSSIRLDQPDYSNIPHGLGVFGNSVTVTMTYPIHH